MHVTAMKDDSDREGLLALSTNGPGRGGPRVVLTVVCLGGGVLAGGGGQAQVEEVWGKDNKAAATAIPGKPLVGLEVACSNGQEAEVSQRCRGRHACRAWRPRWSHL